MAAAMKSAYCYKRSLHHFGQSSRSSSNSEDVAFGVVHDSNEKYNSEETQELTSELSTTSTSTGSSHSSTNGQSENASAASIANRLNKLENYTEVEVKGLSRTRSVQTLPQINASDSRHYPEARPKTSISLNASIPFDEIPIKTRYSSTVSLAQANSRSSPCFDQVVHLSSIEQTPSPFETPFSQSVAANLDQPEPLRPFQRNATEFIKSPKNFLKRGNRKIFPVTKLSTVISHPPVSRVSPKKAAAPVKYKDYTSPVLAHFERPREAYLNCMSQLEDSNWETVMVGLNNFRRLIRHHPEYIDAHIHVVAGILAKHVRNLRSQVSRAACQATEEFFFTHRKQLETEADDLVTTLLHRTADTNKFLRKDATKALESMCDNLTTQKVIHLLSTRGVTHQNALVRTKTSELLSRLVVNLTADKVYAMNKDSRDRIFLTGAQLLNEGSLETRNHAKQMFRELSTHLKYQKVLLEVIPQKLYRQIEKALKKVEN